MRHRRRSILSAAALILMGAAALLLVAAGAPSGPATSALSNDPMPYASGDVPLPASGEIADEPADVPRKLPQRSPKPSETGPKKILPTSRDSGPELATGSASSGVRVDGEPGLTPTALAIPAIGVSGPVIGVGTTPEGAMEAPANDGDVGWWSPGALPGERGKAVLAGHVDSPSGPAIFYRLGELKPGDEILVGAGQRELRYVVRGVALYHVDAAPLEDIFGPSRERELILITCGGEFDRDSASYLHRTVVFAVLADE